MLSNKTYHPGCPGMQSPVPGRRTPGNITPGTHTPGNMTPGRRTPITLTNKKYYDIMAYQTLSSYRESNQVPKNNMRKT
ncbi:hypothetical protein SK128_017613 [Halocaridina rubra]|uniref:Uncharacterized protein n=1 Tax=Halocaridina rubra TaxID=373956 RepID=A0AAN9FX36_HALRR